MQFRVVCFSSVLLFDLGAKESSAFLFVSFVVLGLLIGSYVSLSNIFMHSTADSFI